MILYFKYLSSIFVILCFSLFQFLFIPFLICTRSFHFQQVIFLSVLYLAKATWSINAKVCSQPKTQRRHLFCHEAGTWLASHVPSKVHLSGFFLLQYRTLLSSLELSPCPEVVLLHFLIYYLLTYLLIDFD